MTNRTYRHVAVSIATTSALSAALYYLFWPQQERKRSDPEDGKGNDGSLSMYFVVNTETVDDDTRTAISSVTLGLDCSSPPDEGVQPLFSPPIGDIKLPDNTATHPSTHWQPGMIKRDGSYFLQDSNVPPCIDPEHFLERTISSSREDTNSAESTFCKIDHHESKTPTSILTFSLMEEDNAQVEVDEEEISIPDILEGDGV